jgi:glycosyltransferase involved in cell wall biosynthesis
VTAPARPPTRVTAIVAVYNREEYVRECIESILSTGYPALEVLVVDDGSTDGTPAILAALAAESGGVRILHNPGRRNEGQKASTNLALERAAGEYVCFLDSDDVMLPHRFETSVPLLDGDPGLDGVVEVAELVFEDEEQRRRWGDRAPRYGPRVAAIPADGFLAACLLERTCSMHTSNILVRRRLFEKSGAYRPTRERSEDFHLWLRLAACGRFAVGEIERPVTRYRRHAGNVWSPDRGDSVRDVEVLADVLAWARRSPHVSARNVAVLREAYRRKARWCLATLRAEGDRAGLAALSRRLLARDPAWILDRVFAGNVVRGLLARPRRSAGEGAPRA